MAWKNKDARGTWEGTAAVAIAENLLVHRKADGLLDLADATTGTAKAAIGFAGLAASLAGNKVSVIRTGKLAGVTDGAGAVLVTGDHYYTDWLVPGGITRDKAGLLGAAGALVQRVGVACSTTELEICIETPHTVASSGVYLQ